MNSNTRTSGAAFGNFLGATAAHAVHYAALTGTGIGRFAADTATGAAAGYQATSAERCAQRMQRSAARLAAQQPITPIGVLMTA